MTEAQKDAAKAKRLSDKAEKKRGVSKTVTISDEPTIPQNAGTEFGRMLTPRRLKNDEIADLIRII